MIEQNIFIISMAVNKRIPKEFEVLRAWIQAQRRLLISDWTSDTLTLIVKLYKF